MRTIFLVLSTVIFFAAISMSVTNAVYIRKYPDRVSMWRWVIDQVYLLAIIVYVLIASKMMDV